MFATMRQKAESIRSLSLSINHRLFTMQMFSAAEKEQADVQAEFIFILELKSISNLEVLYDPDERTNPIRERSSSARPTNSWPLHHDGVPK